jgi:hypothetical protein
MKCIFEDCSKEKLVGRYLCQKHFDYVKHKGKLNDYPLMNRPKGSGCFHDGYKKLTINGERIFEHRYIIEKAIGRKLDRNEKVHHKDGDRLNNSLGNLIITDQGNHVSLFHNNRPRVFDWNKFKPKNNGICQICKQPTTKKIGLCRKHYDTYWHWKSRH